MMSLFNSDRTSPTKLFINLPQEDFNANNTTRNLSKLVPGGAFVDIILNAAPKLIEEGMELISATISKFAEKDVTKTIVKRNIDILNGTQISIPRNLTIIRGNFAPKVMEEGTSFGDAGVRQTTLIGNKELHIEMDIVQSEDKKSIAFQPTKYFYNGVDREDDEIHEIVLACAFVPVNQTVINIETLTFQSFLHFEHLKPHTEYEFKSKDGYDSSYQSSWMQPAIDPTLPYTLVIEIQEIREGNSFAKLLNTVYVENKSYIKEELNAKIKLLDSLNRAQNNNSENTNLKDGAGHNDTPPQHQP